MFGIEHFELKSWKSFCFFISSTTKSWASSTKGNWRENSYKKMTDKPQTKSRQTEEYEISLFCPTYNSIYRNSIQYWQALFATKCSFSSKLIKCYTVTFHSYYLWTSSTDQFAINHLLGSLINETIFFVTVLELFY